MTGIFLLILVGVSPAQADIGPENVLVVVNAESAESMTVANHYLKLREVPSNQVILLSGVPTANRIKLSLFRSTILDPILAEIGERQLGSQVRLIAYSTGFPLEVDISKHRNQIKDANLRKLMTPIASINGATFHFRHLIADSPGYLSPTANLYSRMVFGRFFANPFNGDDQQRFDQALQKVKEESHQEAADEFAQLFMAAPQYHPIAILAARHYAAAEQPEKAKEWIQLGLEAGWPSAEFFRLDRWLEPLVEDPQIAPLLSQLDNSPVDLQPAIGFRGDLVWSPGGVPIRGGHGVNYLLSCCLGITGENGMTTDEVIEQLERSVAADYSHPKGVFLFSKTSDVRTKTRAGQFSIAIKRLGYLGHRAQTFSTKMPRDQKQIAGLMIGTPSFSWAETHSKLMAGALADNLTSWGGVMRRPGQTKLTALLRAGAALSSGTVTEPYANQLKFPHPMMHAHYAEGLTAIEAMYSSINAPYQLLIAGEPLCRPFAPRPRLSLKWVGNPKKPNEIHLIAGASPSLEKDPVGQVNKPVKEIELFMGGRRVGSFPPTHPTDLSTLTDFTKAIPLLQVSLSDLAPGAHRLQATVVYDNAIESRQSIGDWIVVRGKMPIPYASVRKISPDGSVKVQLAADEADAIELRYFGRTVGRVTQNVGEVAISAEDCGRGPIRLLPVAIVGDQEVFGKPVEVGLVETPEK